MSFTGRFENLFKASYMRNHKAVTTKNLRCFPVCGEEHRDNGFCGNEVVVTWTCEGPVPPQEVETYAEFQEAEDAPRYKIGQVVSDAELSDDSERNKDERNKRNLMKGETKEGADPFHGSLHFARESKGWHYGWMAGRGNGSHALHEMRVYLFERISPDSSVCRLVMNSSPFVVTSRKRLRGRKNAKDEAESAEDEDDDEDGSKKRSKKTPQSKTMPLPKKPVIHQQHPQHQPMLMKPNQPQGIPPMGMPPLSSKQLTVPSFASQSNHPEVPRFDNSSSSSQIQFAQPPQRRLPSFVGHLSSSGGQPLGPTPPTYLPTPPSHGMGGMQGLQVPSFARGIPQWPFAVSSTPPIYQHASTTPPIYAHPSTTPPIYNLPFNSFGADFPSYAQPQVSDSDVLESLLGPTPPSSFSSLLSMKHQSAPLFMSQQRNDR